MKKTRWRAPREDGAVLVDPPWKELPGVVERNQELVKQSPLRLGGQSLEEVRQQAAEQSIRCAVDYANDLDMDPPGFELKRPLIATGHQPELYHPGVLVKNIATAALAQRLGGVGLNLTVESDLVKETGLRLPVRTEDHFDESLHFTSDRPPLLFDWWGCHDERVFASLPDRARAITQTWPWKPVLDRFWDEAARVYKGTKVIYDRFVAGRHFLEVSWGVANHELVLGQLSGTSFFGLLLGTFVERRAELAAIYNEELSRYRRELKIRSRHHPAADLEVSGDRVELPLWSWRGSQRGRLCAQTAQGGVEFFVVFPDREEPIPGTWPAEALSFQRDYCESRILSWPKHPAYEWAFRPKALVTSMLMRLFVADLFIHGIGGAVYDELTDRIFRRFFGTELPAFAVVTATLRLPWGEQPVGEENERRLRQKLHSLHWNPDRFLPATVDGPSRQYVERKQQLIQQPTDATALRERHHQFEEVREHLRPYVAEEERRTEAALHETHRHHRRDEHRFSREHAWVLYPEEALLKLRDWFRRDAERSAG